MAGTRAGERRLSYLPDDTPAGVPSPDEAPYWAACQAHELRVQRCASCGRHRHPPAPFCPVCRSEQCEWRKVPGTGTVFSYTVAHQAAHPALKQALPYNVAVVLLDEADDVRLVTNVVDAGPEEIAIGLRVTVVWEKASDGRTLPRFRKAEGG